MHRAVLCLILVAGFSSAVQAQQPAPTSPSARRESLSLGEVTPTPEMWFYLQEQKRYDDPQLALRRNAEFEQQQRQARLAARRWLGLSNLRPVADPQPTMGDYSPRWTSGNYMPSQWSGGGGGTIVVIPSGTLR